MGVKFFNKAFTYTPFLAVLALIYAASAMSIGPLLVRWSEIGPFATAFYRFFFALPVLMIWMMFDNLKKPTLTNPPSRADYFLLLGSGCLLAVDISFWYLSILNTTVINATLLNNLTVISVPFISWLFFKEKLSAALIVGIILTISGSCVLVGHSFSFQAMYLVGDIQALISAVFYSVFMLIIKKLRTNFTTSTILAWGALPSIYILGMIGYLNGEQFFPQTAAGWLYLFGIAFIVHVLGQGLLTYAIAHLSASISVIVMSLSPIFSAVLAWLIMGETLTPLQSTGAIVVLIGIIIAQDIKFLTPWKKRKQTTHAS